jgi:hypothetical protein
MRIPLVVSDIQINGGSNERNPDYPKQKPPSCAPNLEFILLGLHVVKVGVKVDGL